MTDTTIGTGGGRHRAQPNGAQPNGASPSLLAGVGRGSTVNLAGTAVSAVTTFGLTIVVTRGVPPDQAGVLFSATSLFVIAITAGQLGTQTGLVYFIGRCRAHGDLGQVLGYVREALRPVIAVALVMAVGMFVFAPQLAELTNPQHVELATAYLRVLAGLVPAAGIEQVYLAGTRGFGTMRPNALVELIGRPALQMLLVWLSVLVAGSLLAWSWAIAYAPAALVSWLWWRLLARRLPPEISTVSRSAFWRFTGPRAITSVLQIAMQRLDIVLLGALGGAVQAAVYTAATRFVVAGQMGNSAVSMAAQPALAVSLAKNDHAGTKRIYQTSTAWLMLVTWPLYLIFACFGHTLLAVFGGRYSAGSSVLLLLSLAMLVATGLGMVDMVLAMAGHTTLNLANAGLALVTQIGLDVWLIPGHGVTGAAVGWSVAIVVRNVTALVQVGWVLRLHPFGTATATCSLLSVSCYAVIPLALRSVLGQTLTTLAVAILLGTALFLVGAWLLRSRLELDVLLSRRRRQN